MNRILYTLLALCLVQTPMLVAQDIPNRSEITITKLEFNTSADDFSSEILPRSRVLYFTSDRSGPFNSRGDQYIWNASESSAGIWNPAESAGDVFDPAREAGAATLTPDGNYMIFAAYEWDGDSRTLQGEGRTDLYSAEYRGGAWTNVQNLGSIINSPYWDSQPSLSSDGRQIYFASDRPGGEGGVDIWFSRRTATGWTAPENAGPVINTVFDEMSPKLSPDNQRLFFSSNGHRGVGGFDIFVTEGRAPFGAGWQSIVNVGRPINSEFDEHFFEVEMNSDNGYFSSNRSGNFDVYLAYPNPYPSSMQAVVYGRVRDAQSQLPIEADITITDLESGEEIAQFRSDDVSGEYTVILNQGRRYSVTAEAPGYVFYSNEYSVPTNLDEGEEIEQDINLRAGLTRLLVYFDYDKADLKPGSMPDLRRAVEYLQTNPDISVEIAGHTDSIGSADYNRNLSQRRAEAVRRWFVDQGVKGSRITARGYGEDEPVADNGSDEGRALNRRVEMRLVSDGG